MPSFKFGSKILFYRKPKVTYEYNPGIVDRVLKWTTPNRNRADVYPFWSYSGFQPASWIKRVDDIQLKRRMKAFMRRNGTQRRYIRFVRGAGKTYHNRPISASRKWSAILHPYFPRKRRSDF